MLQMWRDLGIRTMRLMKYVGLEGYGLIIAESPSSYSHNKGEKEILGEKMLPDGAHLWSGQSHQQKGQTKQFCFF